MKRKTKYLIVNFHFMRQKRTKLVFKYVFKQNYAMAIDWCAFYAVSMIPRPLGFLVLTQFSIKINISI